MRRALSLLIALAVCAMPMAPAVRAQAGKTLDIYYIDTEGGQATLFVSPTGETLLVDAGNAGERDLNRIVEVLKLAGVKQIDHFWLTHYHGDHYGSLIDIAKQVPIKHLYDHGPSIEGDRPNIIKFQAAYADFYKSIPRTIVKPGDKLSFAGTDTTAVMSNSVPLKTAVAKAPGAGRPNPLCAAHKPRDESKVDPDNHYSAGFVMSYGRFRTIDLGDLTWSREFMLMCPNNTVGTVDLYLTNFGANRLYRNNCDGTFTDVSSASGVSDPGWSVSAAFVDYDRDGWLDLYVGHYVEYSIANDQRCTGLTGRRDYCTPAVYTARTDRLFHNERNGTFKDVTGTALPGGPFGPALGVSTADFNGDGWPDIYVANDGNRICCGSINGTAHSEHRTDLRDGVERRRQGEGSMGVDAGDADNGNGDDLFMAAAD
jgi:hypothetical protein